MIREAAPPSRAKSDYCTGPQLGEVVTQVAREVNRRVADGDRRDPDEIATMVLAEIRMPNPRSTLAAFHRRAAARAARPVKAAR
jgi:hypothetical protein